MKMKMKMGCSCIALACLFSLLLADQFPSVLCSPTANHSTPSTIHIHSPYDSIAPSPAWHQLPIGWFASDRILNKLVTRQTNTPQHASLIVPFTIHSHAKRQVPNPRGTINSEFRNNSVNAGAGSIEHSHEELFKIVPEVHNIYLALALIPAFIVFFGCFSAFVKERLYIGESTISVVFGILLGPYASGVFDPRSWGAGRNFDDLTLELTRIVVALSVFAVGVELPKAYILRHWKSLAVLLGPAMLFGWIVSGALIYALVPALTFLQALVIAAAVTPTDPVLAASVVGKGKYAQKHVPAHLRHLLQAESGCNDGAAFPFLYLAMFLLMREETGVGLVIGKWLLLVVLYQILLGIVIGVAIGILARKTLKFCKRRSMIDKESMVAMYVALALLTTGVTALAGSDDLLAAFACGAAFAWDDWFTESIETSNFSSILDLLINCTTFIYIGATIPFSSWNDVSLTLVPWRLVVLGFSIIFLRRLPIMIIMQKIVPDLKTHREAVFSGHFGPIGVGALFISTLATAKLPTPQEPPETSLDILALTTQSLIYLLIFFSVLIHGLSIPFFTLGKNVHSRVHTMTRTWTQASGNEPSWLSRVKRVERPADDNPDVPKLEEKEVHDSPQVPPSGPATPDMVPGQRQISDDQVTRVGDQKEIVERPASEEEIPSQTRPPLTGSMTDPPQHDQRAIPTRAGLLRLASRTKRTPEEQAARQREKMIRDAWCRPERIDVVKKDEERVYKSGRWLVVERGDGDEVEVHNLPRETSKKSLRDLANLQVFSNPISDGSGPSKPGSARKFDLAKIVTPHSAGKQKVSQAQDPISGMPLPGQGPSSKTLSAQQLNNDDINSSDALPTLVSTVGEQSHSSKDVWDEGTKLVIENKDGTDVHVEPRPTHEIKSSRSLPKMTVASEQPSLLSSKAPLNASLPIFTSDGNVADSAHRMNDSKAPEKVVVKEDCDDEWEEDDFGPDLDGEGVPSSSKFYDGPVDCNQSTASHLLYPSRHSKRSKRKGNPLSPRQTVRSGWTAGGSHAVEFADTEKPSPRVARGRTKRSSRPSSPSRSIRFAEYPDRPSRSSSRFHKRSSSTKAYHKNSAEPSQASGYFVDGHSTSANAESSQRISSFPGGGHDDSPLPPGLPSRTSPIETDIREAAEQDDNQAQDK
ncbi:hypothetical protein PCASD_06824 [Puccinia coronata f. sp. avenae]|uniref:Cation/H+ exchanger transmembrane domain-containing protein n=1 Tax=Puccinia coronata f. sp. avenae TaxID=200324 RepID=A0A2N5UQD7_9BASI|nr:hypothetical protein PCASD_06824 [Puccinia coronata f. sp. avenae]